MAAGGGGGGGAGEQRPYELVVFGASGFTGQFVVEEVARAASGGELRGALRWAVAGRSRTKLQEVLEQAAERLGTHRGRGPGGRRGTGTGRSVGSGSRAGAEGLGKGPGAVIPAVTAVSGAQGRRRWGRRSACCCAMWATRARWPPWRGRPGWCSTAWAR